MLIYALAFRSSYIASLPVNILLLQIAYPLNNKPVGFKKHIISPMLIIYLAGFFSILCGKTHAWTLLALVSWPKTPNKASPIFLIEAFIIVMRLVLKPITQRRWLQLMFKLPRKNTPSIRMLCLNGQNSTLTL